MFNSVCGFHPFDNFFYYYYFTLQYCSGFAIHQHESAMSVHVPHHPEPPSHLPSHAIPLGCPRALSLNALFIALNLDWLSILHMVIYTFQCYFPVSSHPCLLPQSPKVCSLHLCLFCCLAYSIIVTIFLNSIYLR